MARVGDYGDIDGNTVPYIQPHGSWSHLYWEYHRRYGRNSVCSAKELESMGIRDTNGANIMPLDRALAMMHAKVGTPGPAKKR